MCVSVYGWFTRHPAQLHKSNRCNTHLMSCTLPALDATSAAKMATAGSRELWSRRKREETSANPHFRQGSGSHLQMRSKLPAQ